MPSKIECVLCGPRRIRANGLAAPWHVCRKCGVRAKAGFLRAKLAGRIDSKGPPMTAEARAWLRNYEEGQNAKQNGMPERSG